MSRDETLILSIFEHARMIRDNRSRFTPETFAENDFERLAFDKALQNIGEAARTLSEEGRAAVADIPWPKIVGLRHVIVHEYFRLEAPLIWQTCQEPMDQLIAALQPIVAGILARRNLEQK